ncbi:MAG: DNA polymerase III subunit beta [Armatimonadetes bacterium CG_4_10_14_3_um_filter_66_18]|nr:DNA polymerase III subunit beta [Armatimonadota bacterium]PIU87620.1 MAG: DNA polymerase III subunit beta [Armatimonadetes bacterium CG06_land_8_20_14_3_00_66_21]PIW13166.1 MAG: DNA polymerase III subunit beta [Armatimonadetes bacterium CG17_big_fil_post_rev_8_21_14_2_50_66_6]PIY42285.1 MAG: DNA polymerase III subunit beta [Armatimonadetes bacterium CG_4_10_14_3_um_filter_66_18]PIZ41360.1 MAG: DNA polymerase III subunit beta [Armatimonadetes bacterium CG_4_10_14_0_8_um_filter_66_14]PJB70198
MKLRCQRNELAFGVQTVSRAVSGKSTLPILSNVLLEASDGQLQLTATDLELSLRCKIAAEIEEEGAITVPCQLFQDVVTNFVEAQIELRLEENQLNVMAGVSDYNIRTLPAEEYPVLPEADPDQLIRLGQGTLKRLIGLTSFACSKEDTRAIMTGALVEIGGATIRVVATDTHRLALAQSALPEPAEVDTSAIIPARALIAMERVLAPEDERQVEIGLGENLVQISTDDVVMVSRLIDGQFPNYRRVIPAEHDKRLVLEREPFALAVRNVRVVAQRDANKIILETADGVLQLRAESQEVGKGYEEVPVKVEGDDVQIAFNAVYLEDVLRILDVDTVVMDLAGSLSPGVIRLQEDDDYLYVLMPMQLT